MKDVCCAETCVLGPGLWATGKYADTKDFGTTYTQPAVNVHTTYVCLLRVYGNVNLANIDCS